jgi:hypothetical protein
MRTTPAKVVSAEVDLRSRLDLPHAALFCSELHPWLINAGVGRVLSLFSFIFFFFVVSAIIQFYD